jgi:hypothetical protein
MKSVAGKVFVVPGELADYFTGVGVEQQFGGIKAVAAVRAPRAMRAQTVDLSRLCPGQVTVPDIAAVYG